MRPGETLTQRDRVEVEAFRRFLEQGFPTRSGVADRSATRRPLVRVVPLHWYAYARSWITAAEALEVDDLRRIAA